MPTKRSLTPKQRVLRKFPKANAFQWKGCWCIYDGGQDVPPFRGQEVIGEARCARVAWKLAAMRIAL